MFIHGFLEKITSGSSPFVIEAYKKRNDLVNDHNVIVLNWGDIASANLVRKDEVYQQYLNVRCFIIIF